jgi:uncharacterized protein YbaR (Trm112 family)
MEKAPEGPIPDELFKVIACPIDLGELEYNKDRTALKCKICNKEYPINDGIPDLTP